MKPSLAAALQLHQRCMSVLNQRTRIQQLLPHEAFAALDAIIEESDLGFKDIDALTWKREVEHWLLSEGAPEKEQVLSWIEKWLVGKSPPPRCTFTRRLQDDEFRCMNHCRSRDGGSFCWELHCCRSTQPHSPFCANPRPDLRGVMFCDEHRCRFTSLMQVKKYVKVVWNAKQGRRSAQTTAARSVCSLPLLRQYSQWMDRTRVLRISAEY